MKNGNKYLIAILLMMISIINNAQEENYNNGFDSILVAGAAYNSIVGITAGYSIAGDVIWTNAHGYGNVEEDIKFEEQTLTRTASIAKSMTAVAIMQLVEIGMLDLDLPIQRYIPDYPKKKKGEITVRHLLSHRSGIPGYKNYKETETTKQYDSLSDAAKVFVKRKLKFEPSTSYAYTTYGYVVLGLIIENVSGLTYEQYMKKNIWSVAGMNNTGVEQLDKLYDNRSQLYHFEKGESKLGKKNNLSNRTPGGGMYSTLHDILKFGNGILDNLFIKEETFKSMIEPHSVREDGNSYGFGWFLYAKKDNEYLVVGHSGGQTGASNQLFIRTDTKTVVALLSNTSGRGLEMIGLAAQLMNNINYKTKDQ